MLDLQALPNNSSLPLGHLRAIARSGIFDGLRLCRREAFAIGGAVMHPLVMDLDDETLRCELLRLSKQLLDLPG